MSGNTDCPSELLKECSLNGKGSSTLDVTITDDILAMKCFISYSIFTDKVIS